MNSSVRIHVPSYGYTYTFSGVLSLQHFFSLKLRTESESVYGTDYINGARNQPDRVILTVVESDVGRPAGWSDRMLQAMESVKRNRCVCVVTTPAFVYAGMLLSEIAAIVDETTPSGWQGTLTFTHFPVASTEFLAYRSALVAACLLGMRHTPCASGLAFTESMKPTSHWYFPSL